MNAGSMRWRQAEGRLILTDHGGGTVEISLDGREVAQRYFRHDPPLPVELERAIDAIEDALMAVAASVGKPREFVTEDRVLRDLTSAPAGSRLGIERVEALFQRLASASLKRSPAGIGGSSGGEAFATLLLLRESMHHLGVESILFESSGEDAA